MGYLTTFILTIKEDPNDEYSEIELYLNSDDNEDKYFYHLLDRDYNDAVTWYNHETDMKEISKLFPDVVFQLDGEGDQNLDVWTKYFKNGKMQDCPAIISFDEYNENKLV